MSVNLRTTNDLQLIKSLPEIHKWSFCLLIWRHTIIMASNKEDHFFKFLEILKHMLKNYFKILKKMFIKVFIKVLNVIGSDEQEIDSYLEMFRWKCYWAEHINLYLIRLHCFVILSKVSLNNSIYFIIELIFQQLAAWLLQCSLHNCVMTVYTYITKCIIYFLTNTDQVKNIYKHMLLI